ncbi:HPr kinase/phosphorylase [Metabacillus sp. Hm71]|uniref:HPr kinase/phosphorylase n=1 Tax=Metabacillus sp. Hm71 TaxID=3450743 RepID=UPI003F444169
MLHTSNKVLYKAFGLTIISEIPLPELPVLNEHEVTIDLYIMIGGLSKMWNELASHPYQVVVKENLVLFQIPNLAIFSIEDGNKIIVSPINGANEDQIRLYILGSCMGALLMQRKIFPLHGSAVAIGGKAYAIIGDSGAGKSTLAATFLKHGYNLLSDDVIAISLTKENIPFVTPAYPQQKLWQESLAEFGIESNLYRSIKGRETKFCVPVQTQYLTEPLPLEGIFELSKFKFEKVEMNSIQGLERLKTIFNHTYRNTFISGLGIMNWHFSTSASIVNQTKMFQLKRPESGFTVHELMSLILSET